MAIETLRSLYRAAGMDDPPPIMRKKAMGGAGGFDAATTGRRGKGWNPPRLGGNTLYSFSGDTVVARSRDAFRNSGWAVAASDSFTANLIGTGARMVTDHPEIAALWAKWSKQCDSEFDPTIFGSGVGDFEGLQQLAAREIYEGGEVFVRIHPRPIETDPRDGARTQRGLAVPLQIELIQAEQLPLWQTAQASAIPAGHAVRSGIEYDSRGRRVAYHFYKVHPGETTMFTSQAFEVERVPAKHVIHAFKPLHAGQLRGLPALTATLAKLNEIEKLVDAELVRRATCAMLNGFLIQAANGMEILPTDPNMPTEDINTAIAKLEPGSFPALLPGEDVRFADTPDSGDFPGTLKTFLQAFAIGAGITYEQATGDLAGVTFSSIRAGLLEFRRKIEQFQFSVLVYKFLQPIFQHFLRAAVMSGALVLDAYAEDPERYENVQWVMPGWDWVDPLKDIQAKQLEIQCGLGSRTKSAAALGYDAREIDRENAADREREKSLGLRYGTDATLGAPSRAAVESDATQKEAE